MENTDWSAKKQAAKRLFDKQLRSNFRIWYEEMSNKKVVLDIAKSSPTPYEVQAEILATKLEQMIRRKVDKMPLHEVELLDSVITLLRSFEEDRTYFVKKLSDGYEEQIEYWSGFAKSRGTAMKIASDTDMLEIIISKMTQNERKG